MANAWNLWVWLVSVVVRRYMYYRYPHNNYKIKSYSIKHCKVSCLKLYNYIRIIMFEEATLPNNS